MQPRNAKAFYRQGCALKGKGELLNAVGKLNKAIKLQPENEEAIKVLNQVKKTISDKQARALETEEEKQKREKAAKEEKERKEKLKRLEEAKKDKARRLAERKLKRDLGRFDDLDLDEALDQLEEEEGRKMGLDPNEIKQKKVMSVLQDNDFYDSEEDKMRRMMGILGHQYKAGMLDEDDQSSMKAQARDKPVGFDDPFNKAATSREKQEV